MMYVYVYLFMLYVLVFLDIRQLELGSNRIRVIEGLQHLVKLEQLWLGRNKITKIQVN